MSLFFPDIKNNFFVLHKCSILLILLIIPIKIFSSGELLFPGGRSNGMGGAYTAINGDIESIAYNSAGLMNIEKLNAFFSTKKLYDIDDLKHSAIGVGYGNNKLGGVGFLYEEVGYDLHKEKTYQLSYGRKINRFMGLGCNLKIYEINITNFGSDRAVGVDFGYLSRIYEKLYFGINAKNFNNPKIGTTIQKSLNKSVTAGLAYQARKFTISLDAMKEPDYDLQFRAGAEIILFNVIAMRYGYNNDPKRNFYGIGLKLKNIDFSWAMYDHQYLDNTNQFGINIKF